MDSSQLVGMAAYVLTLSKLIIKAAFVHQVYWNALAIFS